MAYLEGLNKLNHCNKAYLGGLKKYSIHWGINQIRQSQCVILLGSNQTQPLQYGILRGAIKLKNCNLIYFGGSIKLNNCKYLE